jgi:DNA adenine methylase
VNAVSSIPTRPVMRYYGGKWRLAGSIVKAMPKHAVYVEPFMGACSVFLQKPRVTCEVINDLHDEVVNVFKMLRDRGAELKAALEMTPYARTEYELAYDVGLNPLENARRFIFRSTAGIGSNSSVKKNGFRTSLCDLKHATATSWKNLPPHLDAVVHRLQGVIIENRPAMKVMSQYDADYTLHYCDPPYMGETRKSQYKGYAHEMTSLLEHEELLEFVKTLKGKVIISGYRHSLYDLCLKEWYSCPLAAGRDQTNAVTKECLWMNFEPRGELI